MYGFKKKYKNCTDFMYGLYGFFSQMYGLYGVLLKFTYFSADFSLLEVLATLYSSLKSEGPRTIF